MDASQTLSLMNLEEIRIRLQSLADPEKAKALQRFFKTGPGEYGEGNIFIGLRVPEIRKLAIEYRGLSLSETVKLLQSPIHESRVLALLIMIRAYGKGDDSLKKEICDLYLQNTRFINNWDLVDISAEHIVGSHFRYGGRARLHALAASKLIWERRIAVMATFHYIKHGEFADTLQIAAMLLNDAEDLIHKAVGWMLREIGKRDRAAEEQFLRAYCKIMPRTMLRYAIEKFPEQLRQRYLKGEV
jgi:3-methyladenine DNA glycosylase AlkD